MLKIGVIGAGHLGKIHLKILRDADFVELVGFHDQNDEIRSKVEIEMGINSFESIENLIEKCDIIDIVTPTMAHFDCASKSIKSFKHVFIEKPITSTIEEAQSLISLSEEAKIKVQIGHVERFNPAFTASKNHLKNPMFIETHRLAQFNPRGTDVSVVLDLMIHDIDIVLSVVKSPIKSINASGVSVLSETPDIANARIEFDNGCVANLTASRISMKNMRKSRFFQQDAYVSVDFLEKKNEVIQMHDVIEEDPFAVTIDLGERGKKQLDILTEEILPNNAIEDELRAFVTAIENDTIPPVSIHDGYNALKTAIEIMNKL